MKASVPLKQICFSGILISIFATDTEPRSKDMRNRRLYGTRYIINSINSHILSHRREYTGIRLSGIRHLTFCIFLNQEVQDYLVFRL